ncbi:MAG: RagB/SusD family nutrient uptake outer membrane protein [Tannerellaceae bacterium]|nr:RagB/SusD family nutrient uptake outer membrane protein [Tannerellaceae bacterium]
MKRYILFFVLGCMVLSSSCESWLEENQFDKINSSTLYESEEGLEIGLNGLYSLARRFFRFRDSDVRGSYWFYCATDLALVRTWNEAEMYRSNMRANAMPAEVWSRPYQMIDRASAIIEAAPEIDMQDETRERITSEARVIRAWSYLRLFMTYDNILLDSIPTTPDNVFDERVYKPAERREVLNFINRDLDYAIKYLPYKVNPGIISQGLARQLRAETAMWEEDYATAAAHADAIIASGQYGLVGISEVFGNDINHKESLMAWQFNELAGGEDPGLAGGDGHVLGACFQARFYELSIIGDPVAPILEEASYGGNAYGWTYPNDYLRSLYDEENDRRMQFFFYPDTLYGNNPASEYYEKKLPGDPPYSTQLREYTWSLMKYRDMDKPPKRALSYKPFMAYRLAETYILGAEAHWRSGNTVKALEYLNEVRRRAGLEDVTTIDLQTIMDEHARELCFEGKRWFFLKRIGKLVEQVNKYHRFGSTINSIEGTTMKDYMVRWPIPQAQIDAMGTFPQNDGY